MIIPAVFDVAGSFIAVVAVIAVSVMSIAKMRFRHERQMAKGIDRSARGGDIEARLARVEQALDAMAIEIERTGEAQRYLTKVLAKHLPAGSEVAT